MGGVSRGLRCDRALDIRSLLRSFEIVDLDADPFAHTFPSALRGIFDGLWVTFRALAKDGGWAVDFVHAAGRSDMVVRAERVWEEFISGAPVHFTTFDPLRPAAEERNVVVDSRDAGWRARGQQAYAYGAYRVLGIADHWQTRVLLCDGPMLLAWLGGFRDEAFRPREIEAFRSLVRPLARRLRIERLFRGGCSAFATALDAIPSATFVARDDGSIEHTNEAGARLLERSRRDLVGRIRERIAQGSAREGIAPLEIAGRGAPRRYLVVLDRHDQAGSLEARLTEARTRWRLTPRHVSIVRLLARGDANKDIATKLGLSVGTIEVYVSAIFRRAKVESRLQLVAKLWK